MKTWFMIWMLFSAIIAWSDARLAEVEGDDRPWWGRALFALLAGGVFALVPGMLALLAKLP